MSVFRAALVLAAVVALIAPAQRAMADPEDGTKFTFRLAACLPVGEDDAGGEAEWESDTELLKVEARVRIPLGLL